MSKSKRIIHIIIITIVLFQIFFIFKIPDIDTDSYAHHIISRDIIKEPYNLSIHWVWLPLFHYLQIPFILADINFNTLRFLNIIIWVLSVYLFHYYLSDKNLSTSLPASIIFSLSPLGILMGTTVQPESLFLFLFIYFLISIEKEKYIISAFLLGLASLLRYEAWSIVACLVIVILLKPKMFNLNFTKNKKIYFIVIIPIILVLFWTILRYFSDGKLFDYLSGTHRFANEALQQKSSLDKGIFGLITDIFYYPLYIPFIFMGINMIFVFFGIKTSFKKFPLLFVMSFSILIFLTLSWVIKSNLGLNRHFLILVPFYSLLSAEGLIVVISKSEKIFLKLNRLFKVIPNPNITFKTIYYITLVFYVIMWSSIWYFNNNDSFKEEIETSEYIKTLNKNSIIVTGTPMIEIFSGINFNRFVHYYFEDDDITQNYLKTLKDYGNKYYIIIPGQKYYNLLEKGILFENNEVFKSHINSKTGVYYVIYEIN